MLYDYPKYYEAAFSFRDYFAEVNFLQSCASKYLDRPLANVLEIGCGHAPHAGEFASRGIDYLGMDINPNMLSYARTKWVHLPDQFRLFEADMVKFDSPEKVDLAFVMLGSLYLNNLEEMNSHFDSVARAIRPGGLYFMDWCVQLADPLIRNKHNEVHQVVDGIRITSRFDTKLLDPIEQTYEEKWTVLIDDHGSTRRLQIIEKNRAIFPQEFSLFIHHQTDFELIGIWPDWQFNAKSKGDPGAERPFALLRRV